MPEITQDERGRRIFAIQKQKAVESAVEKIRENMRLDWKVFSSSDIDTLEYILGEVWVSMERRDWEQCAFTLLTRKDLERIIHLGREAKRKEKIERRAVEEVMGVLGRVM